MEEKIKNIDVSSERESHLGRDSKENGENVVYFLYKQKLSTLRTETLKTYP